MFQADQLKLWTKRVEQLENDQDNKHFQQEYNVAAGKQMRRI
jgi:hypothetical protein